ncbi:hypothetical protein B0H13DRAFT_2682327 [Mycena leptocephala]|nr:hypothetical protein B0H13DRAFT_2682327 [Mycena leptocephala]
MGIASLGTGLCRWKEGSVVGARCTRALQLRRSVCARPRPMRHIRPRLRLAVPRVGVCMHVCSGGANPALPILASTDTQVHTSTPKSYSDPGVHGRTCLDVHCIARLCAAALDDGEDGEGDGESICPDPSPHLRLHAHAQDTSTGTCGSGVDSSTSLPPSLSLLFLSRAQRSIGIVNAHTLLHLHLHRDARVCGVHLHLHLHRRPQDPCAPRLHRRPPSLFPFLSPVKMRAMCVCIGVAVVGSLEMRTRCTIREGGAEEGAAAVRDGYGKI